METKDQLTSRLATEKKLILHPLIHERSYGYYCANWKFWKVLSVVTFILKVGRLSWTTRGAARPWVRRSPCPFIGFFFFLSLLALSSHSPKKFFVWRPPCRNENDLCWEVTNFCWLFLTAAALSTFISVSFFCFCFVFFPACVSFGENVRGNFMFRCHDNACYGQRYLTVSYRVRLNVVFMFLSRVVLTYFFLHGRWTDRVSVSWAVFVLR